MNRDIRLSLGFLDHPKTIKLERSLGLEAVKSLLYLWCYAAQNKPEGFLTGMDIDDIEIAAKWRGQPGQFVEALTSPKHLWLDFVDGVYELHDWEDHQGYVVHAPQRTEKAKNAIAKKWEIEGYQPPAGKKSTLRSSRLQNARMLGTHTEEEWASMKDYFDNRCICCDTPDVPLVKNRIVPIYQGGSDSIDNIQPLCKTCNQGKGGATTDYRKFHDPELKCLTIIKTSRTSSQMPDKTSKMPTKTSDDVSNVHSGTKTSTKMPDKTSEMPTEMPIDALNVYQNVYPSSFTLTSTLPLPEGEKTLAETAEPVPAAGADLPDLKGVVENGNTAAGDPPPKEPVVKEEPLPKVSFDYKTGKFINLAGTKYLETWGEAYPAIDLILEIKKAAAWLLSNPKNRKSDLPKFLNNWLQRAQNQAPATGVRSTHATTGGKGMQYRTTGPQGAVAEAARQANMATILRVCEQAGVDTGNLQKNFGMIAETTPKTVLLAGGSPV